MLDIDIFENSFFKDLSKIILTPDSSPIKIEDKEDLSTMVNDRLQVKHKSQVPLFAG